MRGELLALWLRVCQNSSHPSVFVAALAAVFGCRQGAAAGVYA
jgi:hypothetical protein